MVGALVDSDNIVHRMAVDDPIPWYRKTNLRYLYFMLFPCLMGIEMTSGFDSQIINAVQLVPAWTDCKFLLRVFYWVKLDVEEIKKLKS